jgi:hypothetical protein
LAISLSYITPWPNPTRPIRIVFPPYDGWGGRGVGGAASSPPQWRHCGHAAAKRRTQARARPRPCTRGTCSPCSPRSAGAPPKPPPWPRCPPPHCPRGSASPPPRGPPFRPTSAGTAIREAAPAPRGDPPPGRVPLSPLPWGACVAGLRGRLVSHRRELF